MYITKIIYKKNSTLFKETDVEIAIRDADVTHNSFWINLFFK